MNVQPENRRDSARFALRLRLRYRVLKGLRTVARGHGTTVDISRTAIRFSTIRELPLDARVELALDWPVRFAGVYPMELRVVGVVAQRRGSEIVVQIAGWHFRLSAAGREIAPEFEPAHGWARFRNRVA